ncbi:DUF692 domain-containing protein [Asticcacaulis benevestitus]|uniref:Uncharacterized protein n=1 Tax=Asticcacaulis benevestitus DSM 16100 = ATCC BAA-896 TaxID=1121022 RepID=V4RKP7_9CAUL|nr:DUF692 domain-containing protein [Asticcacaulis benevestitus]ESQ91878.1 hypothetical protein ABENE_09600 [Asticcacaulis benevestitus DSM 16100 = ATCC BAA-896]
MIHSPTAGVGLKPEHYAEAAEDLREGLWFEVHPENYMAEGGPRLAWLETIALRHPLSLHGVGMSLAADELPDDNHLRALKRLIDRFQPFAVSEHLAWSTRRGAYAPDLLPFPRTSRALDRIAHTIDHAQSILGVRLLIENPSLYMPLRGHDMDEPDFLRELVQRTGCGLLVDINNVHISAHNLGYDAELYLAKIPVEAIGEIHLAGHEVDPGPRSQMLIDTHAAPISDRVWELYERLIARIGPRPTLIERDDNIPLYDVLMSERDRAHGLLTAAATVNKALAHV